MDYIATEEFIGFCDSMQIAIEDVNYNYQMADDRMPVKKSQAQKANSVDELNELVKREVPLISSTNPRLKKVFNRRKGTYIGGILAAYALGCIAAGTGMGAAEHPTVVREDTYWGKGHIGTTYKVDPELKHSKNVMTGVSIGTAVGAAGSAALAILRKYYARYRVMVDPDNPNQYLFLHQDYKFDNKSK